MSGLVDRSVARRVTGRPANAACVPAVLLIECRRWARPVTLKKLECSKQALGA